MHENNREVSNSGILVCNDSIMQNRKFMRNVRVLDGCIEFDVG